MTRRNRRMAGFYAQLFCLALLLMGAGAALLHAISPEVMVAQAIERETER